MFKRTRVKVILATVAAATAVVLATPVGTVLAEGPRIF